MVVPARRMAHVNELEHQGNLTVRGEIPLNHAAPALLLSLRTFGVAVAREIDQAGTVAAEEVDGDGFPRLGTDPCQGSAPQHHVQKRGFPDVGTAGEHILRHRARRKLFKGAVGSFIGYLLQIHASPLSRFFRALSQTWSSLVTGTNWSFSRTVWSISSRSGTFSFGMMTVLIPAL